MTLSTEQTIEASTIRARGDVICGVLDEHKVPYDMVTGLAMFMTGCGTLRSLGMSDTEIEGLLRAVLGVQETQEAQPEPEPDPPSES